MSSWGIGICWRPFEPFDAPSFSTKEVAFTGAPALKLARSGKRSSTSCSMLRPWINFTIGTGVLRLASSRLARVTDPRESNPSSFKGCVVSIASSNPSARVTWSRMNSATMERRNSLGACCRRAWRSGKFSGRPGGSTASASPRAEYTGGQAPNCFK